MHNALQEMRGNVRVLARVRPLLGASDGARDVVRVGCMEEGTPDQVGAPPPPPEHARQLLRFRLLDFL